MSDYYANGVVAEEYPLFPEQQHNRTPEDQFRDGSNAALLLRAFLAHPILRTSDVLQLMPTHRFACALGSLRDNGHIIKTLPDPDSNGSLYKYIRFDPDTIVPKWAAEVYWDSPHWHEMRQRRKEVDGWECCHCHDTEDLQVHHWKYDLFQENLDDLVTLCRMCHERVHGYDGVRIAFPKRAQPWIVKRLRALKGTESNEDRHN